MKKILIFLLASSFLYPSVSMTANMEHDGHKLLQDCGHAEKVVNGDRTANLAQAAFCTGLISGVATTVQLMGNDHPKINICPPDKIPNDGELVRIILKFVRNNPQKLHLSENVLIMMALIREFPCKK